jgi:sialic acid synthase SpsE
MLGEKEPDLTEADLEYRKNARRCLMADRKMTAGQTLTEDLIRELRPRIEVGAEYIYEYTGKKLTADIEPLSLITPDKLI